LSTGIEGEKSPGIAALLNFLFYGAGYVYVGGRWLIPGICLFLGGLVVSLWSFTLVPAGPITPARASVMWYNLLWLGCASFLVGILFGVHGHRVAVAHNVALRAAPPPPDPGPCQNCRGTMTYAAEHPRWFCPVCRTYA
jgi:hypothetical protein